MNRANWTPEQWARYRAYQQEWQNKNRKKDGDPERYAKYRAYQLAYYRRNREKLNMQKRPVTTEQIEQQRQRQRTYLQKPGPRESRRKTAGDWVRRRAGFTPELVEQLLKLQSNACAICRKQFSDVKKGDKPHADHCHQTNTPRGLLCFQCNIIEGKLIAIGLTPIEFGQRLHEYLLNPPAKSAG